MKSTSNRKNFLKQLAAGALFASMDWKGALFSQGTGPTGNQGEAPPLLQGGDPWTTIQKQFSSNANNYLNTGTLGLMPEPVLSAVENRMKHLREGSYAVPDTVRQAVARLVNAEPSEISLSHNTTEGINVVASGLRLRKGDEVIITDQEHVGNALPWLNRARRTGIRLRVFSPAQTAEETLGRIQALINRKTKVIAVPHVTCTSGHVLPVKQICDIARQKGIFSFIDGAHGPGMLFPDVRDIGCDAYAACGHKWLCGPAGTGFLYIRLDKLESLETYMVGAYSDTGWTLSSAEQKMDALVPTAHRFDYGTQNAALLIGLETAITFMESIGKDRIRDRVCDLSKNLQHRLLEKSYVEMLTPSEAESRAGMLGFRLKGKRIHDFDGSALTKHFRLRMVPESGLESVRVSTHIYNTEEDLEALVLGIDEFMRA
ncbi:MAG: aminotransferase class V-fold PLP-dependent enzyme [Bacteroidia bacterium]